MSRRRLALIRSEPAVTSTPTSKSPPTHAAADAADATTDDAERAPRRGADMALDDARALLSDHLEALLDDADRAAVDAWLARSPELAAERARLDKTLRLVRGMPRPDEPTDMVAKVRARLADEKRPSLAEVVPFDAAKRDVAGKPRRRLPFLEAGLGLALAASIAVVVGTNTSRRGDRDETHAAGLAGERTASRTSLLAPGLPPDVVARLAIQSGMEPVAGASLVFEGDRDAAARFSVELRVEMAKRGGELSGFVPDADRVVVDVKN